MKAAILTKPFNLVIRDIPQPKLRDGWVLVKVIACGVCGSDIRYFAGENPWALHTLGRHQPNPPNIILGHEFAGEVVRVGAEADEHLIGKRVVVLPYEICGTCRECQRGDHHLCVNMIHLGHAAGWPEMPYYYGGMAEYCPVWTHRCHVIPDDLSFEEASCLDFVGVAYHAVRHGGLLFDKSVCVIGCGPIGHTICQLARSMGAARVFALDVYERAVEALRSLSFRNVYAGNGEAKKEIMEITSGCGVDVVWDTVGSKETVSLGIHVLAKTGRFINLATHDIDVSMNLMNLGSERRFLSSANYRVEEFSRALSLVASGKINLDAMTESTFKLEEVRRALDLLQEKAQTQILKAIILPNAPSK